jgi:hypothetical protein
VHIHVIYVLGISKYVCKILGGIEESGSFITADFSAMSEDIAALYYYLEEDKRSGL